MNIKRVIALLLLILTLVVALASCDMLPDEIKDMLPDEIKDMLGIGEEKPEEPVGDGKIDYKVTVVDPFGAPMPQMVVSIYNGDEEIEMRLTNKDGVVTPKEPLTGESFTVKVNSPKGEKLAYDEAKCVLKDGEEEITIVIYQSTEDLYVDDLYLNNSPSGEPVEAPVLTGGGYMVDLIEGENYFVFTPTKRGVYTIAASSSASVSIGYYGSPHFVQSQNLASDDDADEVYMSDGAVCFKVRGFNVGGDGVGSSRYVIMVESDAAAKGFITLGYDEELSMSIQELPWNEYNPSIAPESYVVPEKEQEGFALTDVDITSKTLTIVYNSEDNLYHVGSLDGPVVLLRIASASKYLPSLESIMETDPFAVYVYDDNGEFVDKIIYQNMMEKYCAAADPDLGVIPLDVHLLKAITDYGNAPNHAWFGGASGIFGDDTALVNPALAVYFACCYYAG